MTNAQLRTGAAGGNKIKPSMPRPAEKIENLSDPRGQFGRYLRHRLDNGLNGTALAEQLGLHVRTVQTWAKGQAGPAFSDLDRVAKALGFSDWSKLAAAIVKFAK